MLRKMTELYNWLTLGDYDAANAQASKDIVRRFSRGNISLKNGMFLTAQAAAKLSREGDRAAARLRKKIAAHP